MIVRSFSLPCLWMAAVLVCSSSAGAQPTQQPYDLLLAHGYVLDAKSHVDAVMDVAVKDGKVAEVATHVDPRRAVKTVDAKGLYVTPALVDIYGDVYVGTGEKDSYAGANSVYPDGLTFRSGVTTVTDAGSSGWKNFENFKQRVIDRSQTRVLAFVNTVGAGMRGPKYEDNLDDMDGRATATMAPRYRRLIVGIKSAHFSGPEWKPFDQAVIAGTIAPIPVMIEYGANRHDELGNLSVGSVADVAVLRLKHGQYGFFDMVNAKEDRDGVANVRADAAQGQGSVDLNGMTPDVWNKAAASDLTQGTRWTTQQTRPSGSAAAVVVPGSAAETHYL